MLASKSSESKVVATEGRSGLARMPHVVAAVVKVPVLSQPRHHRLRRLEERGNGHAGERGDGDVGAAHDGAGVGDLGRGGDGVGCPAGRDRGEADGAVGGEGGGVGRGQVDGLGEGLRGSAGDGGERLAGGSRGTGGAALWRLGNSQERQKEGREEGGELHFGGGGGGVCCGGVLEKQLSKSFLSCHLKFVVVVSDFSSAWVYACNR
ncbi:hypothetical protein QBC39DRAFT_104165 [Podospora conica]|nr:hypothetical protein QBC39DRAFT_104165 [Schizothecium conicum]